MTSLYHISFISMRTTQFSLIVYLYSVCVKVHSPPMRLRANALVTIGYTVNTSTLLPRKVDKKFYLLFKYVGH